MSVYCFITSGFFKLVTQAFTDSDTKDCELSIWSNIVAKPEVVAEKDHLPVY